jgi:hypothetical protein
MVHPMLHLWMAEQRRRLEAELARTRSLRELAGMLPQSMRAAVRHRRDTLRGRR